MNPGVTIRLPLMLTTQPADELRTETASDPSPVETALCDEELLAAVCDGSREALAVLFRRHARIVRGVAYRVLRDASEADDLLQDIFLLVHRLCKTFDSSKGTARSWILQMTYRRAISRRRYLTSRHFYTRLDLEDAARTSWRLWQPRAAPSRSGGGASRSAGGAAKDVQGAFRGPAEDPAPVLFRRLHVRRDRRQTWPNRGKCQPPLLSWAGKAPPADADFCWKIAGQGSTMIKGVVQPRSGCVDSKRTP